MGEARAMVRSNRGFVKLTLWSQVWPFGSGAAPLPIEKPNGAFHLGFAGNNAVKNDG